MSSATKQRSHAGRSVFVFFLVFTILVAGVVIGLSRVFKNKDVTPSIAGYSLYIMDSDRMLDKVPRGSLVLASNETPSIEKVGKAVLCENVPGIGTSVFWLADVSAANVGEDGVIYTVYQEKNTAITYDIKSKNVVGEATTYYTWAGKVITFIISRFGMVICIGTPIALLIIIELILAIASSDGYEDDDDDDERVEIEKPSSIDDFLFSGDDATPISKDQLTDEDKEYINSDDADDLLDGSDEEEAEPIAQPEEAEEEEPASEPEPEQPEEEEQQEEREDETLVVKLPEEEKKEETSPEGLTVKIPEEKPEPKPEPKAVKPAAPRPKRKKPETSLEDLVKLMEEQQKKLRDEMNKK